MITTAQKRKVEGTSYRIISEFLWTKGAVEVTTCKNILTFEGREPTMVRSSQEDLLSDHVSIMIARNKKTTEHVCIVNYFHLAIETDLFQIIITDKSYRRNQR